VRRLVAFVLVQGLAVSTAMGSSLHVHEYVEHDHPDHHHGPASHEHHQSAVADHDDHSGAEDSDHPELRSESCDPGQHAVAVTMGCAQVAQLHVAITELPGPTVLVPTAPVRSVTPVTDVRVHGPPFDPRIPSRAPPLTPHA
jgi:ABC-type Zn2+ transport system substrate-binding protein/surface adhesin